MELTILQCACFFGFRGHAWLPYAAEASKGGLYFSQIKHFTHYDNDTALHHFRIKINRYKNGKYYKDFKLTYIGDSYDPLINPYQYFRYYFHQVIKLAQQTNTLSNRFKQPFFQYKDGTRFQHKHFTKLFMKVMAFNGMHTPPPGHIFAAHNFRTTFGTLMHERGLEHNLIISMGGWAKGPSDQFYVVVAPSHLIRIPYFITHTKPIISGYFYDPEEQIALQYKRRKHRRG